MHVCVRTSCRGAPHCAGQNDLPRHAIGEGFSPLRGTHRACCSRRVERSVREHVTAVGDEGGRVPRLSLVNQVRFEAGCARRNLKHEVRGVLHTDATTSVCGQRLRLSGCWRHAGRCSSATTALCERTGYRPAPDTEPSEAPTTSTKTSGNTFSVSRNTLSAATVPIVGAFALEKCDWMDLEPTSALSRCSSSASTPLCAASTNTDRCDSRTTSSVLQYSKADMDITPRMSGRSRI